MVASAGELPIPQRYQAFAYIAGVRRDPGIALHSLLKQQQEECGYDDFLLSAPLQMGQDVATELWSGHGSTWERQLLALDLANMLHLDFIIQEAMCSDRLSISLAAVSLPKAWFYANPNLAHSLVPIYDRVLSHLARRAMRNRVLKHGSPPLAEALYDVSLRQNGLQAALRFLPACAAQFVADRLHNHGYQISLSVWKLLVRNPRHTEVLLQWIEEELKQKKMEQAPVLAYLVTKLVVSERPGLFLEELDREYEWLHRQKTFSWSRLARRKPEGTYRVVMEHIAEFGAPYLFLDRSLVRRYGPTRANQIFRQEVILHLEPHPVLYPTIPMVLKFLSREHRASFLEEALHVKFQGQVSLATIMSLETLALMDDLTRVGIAQQILLQDSAVRVPELILRFEDCMPYSKDYEFRLKVVSALMLPRQEAFARLMSLLVSHYGNGAKKRGIMLGCLFMVSGRSSLAESVSEKHLSQALELVAARYRNDQGQLVHQIWLQSLRTWVPPQHLAPTDLQLLLHIGETILKSTDCTTMSRRTLAQIWWSALRVGQPPLLSSQLLKAVFFSRGVHEPLNCKLSPPTKGLSVSFMRGLCGPLNRQLPPPTKELALVLDDFLHTEYPWPADEEPAPDCLRNFIKLLRFMADNFYANHSLEAMYALTWVQQRLVPWILKCSRPSYAVKMLAFYPRKIYGRQKEYQALISRLWHKQGVIDSSWVECNVLLQLVVAHVPHLLWPYFRGEPLPIWIQHLNSTGNVFEMHEHTWLGTILQHILQSPHQLRRQRWPHSVQRGMATEGVALLETSHSLQPLKKAAQCFPVLLESLMCDLLPPNFPDMVTPPNTFILQILGRSDRPRLALTRLEPYLDGDEAKLVLGALEQLCKSHHFSQTDLLPLLQLTRKVTIRKQVARLALRLASPSECASTWNMLWDQDDHDDVRNALILMLNNLLTIDTPQQREEALWHKLERIIQQDNPSSYLHLQSLVNLVAQSCSTWTQTSQQRVVVLFGAHLEQHLLPHPNLMPQVLDSLILLHTHIDLSLYDTLLSFLMDGLHLHHLHLHHIVKFFMTSLTCDEEEMWKARSERIIRVLRNLFTPRCLQSHLIMDVNSYSTNCMDNQAITIVSLFSDNVTSPATHYRNMKRRVKLCHLLLAIMDDALHKGSIRMFTIFEPYVRLHFFLVTHETIDNNDDDVECQEGVTMARFLDTMVERLGGMCFLYFLADIEKLVTKQGDYNAKIIGNPVAYLQGWLAGLDTLKPECIIARSLLVLRMLQHPNHRLVLLLQQSNKVGVTRLVAQLCDSPFLLVSGLAALPLGTSSPHLGDFSVGGRSL